MRSVGLAQNQIDFVHSKVKFDIVRGDLHHDDRASDVFIAQLLKHPEYKQMIRDAVQPAFDIIAKEHNQTSQNLEELENEHIKDSLTTLMLTVAEKGYGKRTPLSDYRITSRGGKGVVNMKTTRELGLTFPTETMLQLTEVIEWCAVSS